MKDSVWVGKETISFNAHTIKNNVILYIIAMRFFIKKNWVFYFSWNNFVGFFTIDSLPEFYLGPAIQVALKLNFVGPNYVTQCPVSEWVIENWIIFIYP